MASVNLSCGGLTMKSLKPMVVFVFTLLFVAASEAIVINGGKGLPHTRAAWVSNVGHLTVLTHTRFWGQVHQINNQALGLKTAITVWDVQGLVSLDYGLGKHFGLNVTPIAFQDDQSEYGQYPWDTFIGLKIGSFGSKISSLSYGVQLNARFPSGEVHNIKFEDYNTSTVSFGFTGLLSYALDPLYPEDALNMHFNLGYINHNDVGEVLSPYKGDQGSNVLHQSQQGIYGLGIILPTESFDYGLELYGNYWLQKPPAAAAGRESYMYMNASIKYKPYRWCNFILSGEYRMTSNKEETIGPRAVPDNLPNYATWRINLGAQFTLLPTSVFRTSEREILMQRAENRRELFEQIIKERRETESAEEELERIREERRKAERELERLRKILEGQSTRSQDLDEMRKALDPRQNN